MHLPDRGIDGFSRLEKRPLIFRHARRERRVESAHLFHERVEAHAEGRGDLLDVATMTLERIRASPSTTEASARRLTFASDDEVLEAYHARRWTDGLPFVLPTAKRVDAMIAGSGRDGDEVIAVVPRAGRRRRWRASPSTR
jgi:hypothetical protein